MATFNFSSGFYLLLDDGSRLRFEAGEQVVPDDIAGHPYLAANGERLPASLNVDAAPAGEPDAALETPAAAEPAAEDAAPVSAPSVTVEDDGTVHVDTPEEVSEKDALKAQAEALGIEVDGRWGIARLTSEIATKQAAA
ncbi:hypothetical protein Xaut_3634 [Xanthobacter versatilis]|uniref:Uncharacterized protein n=1 Tax=Xanthobacter autotrophicus (strain ATCC BAA-1158 / Py2) TaxID=78245 RepID=A7ILG9_XANP2|nr:hypothetical protein Xaut_3634 [Xanthobacter autotrophicus Py2]